jgi:hypothetical protein
MKNVQKILFIFIVSMFLASCFSNKVEKANDSKPIEPSNNSYSKNPDYSRPAGKDEKENPSKNSPNSTSATIPNDKVSQRIYADYGSIFKAQNGVKPPPSLMFQNDAECASWQNSVGFQTENVGGINLELQPQAMQALLKAREEAKQQGLDITPRGTDAGRRSYSDTEKLWASRVNPGLEHWVKAGRLPAAEADKIRSLSPTAQVSEILNLESQGMYFSKDLSKSILYSVAAPGTSQHLSMLALDVNQHDNSKVREILNRNGWFQTVVSDLPHFTYLGVAENQLSSLGLKKVSNGGRDYWIP